MGGWYLLDQGSVQAVKDIKWSDHLDVLGETSSDLSDEPESVLLIRILIVGHEPFYLFTDWGRVWTVGIIIFEDHHGFL